MLFILSKTNNKIRLLIDQNSKYVSNAYLLMAKARYFRGDYTLAIEDLKRVGDIKKRKIIEEAQYWEALCNWKIGKSNLATNQLESLLKISKSNTIKYKNMPHRKKIAGVKRMDRQRMAIQKNGKQKNTDPWVPAKSKELIDRDLSFSESVQI